MKKSYLLIASIILVLVILILISMVPQKTTTKWDDNQTVEVCFNLQSTCINAEMAYSDEKKQTGLMNQTFLGPSSGMLFPYDKRGIYSFWMSETQLPLDIIWISSDMKIVYIANAIPCPENKQCEIYTPTKPAQYVLEVNSGFASQHNLQIGDEITINR